MRPGALTLSLLVLGCAPKPTPPAVSPDRPDSCRLLAGSSERLDTLTVGLPGPVNMAHAIAPANDSERLLFRNLFDNLVRLDCEGRPRPGLAESWAVDHSRTAWELTLTPDASFPVAGPTSADAAAAMFNAVGITDSLTTESLGLDSATALDDRRLRVSMADPVDDSIPRFLADPALVLIDGLASGPGAGEGSLEIPRRGSRPVIDFRFLLSRDPRDALDRDVDLIVTRDPQLIDYVSNRAEFATFSLPWSRTYVLLEAEDAQTVAPTLRDASIRGSLADAVRAAARVAEPPYWWMARGICRSSPARHSGMPGSHLVYPQDDEVARALAQRVVALAPASAGLRALGLDAPAFADAVRRGTERAYIVGLPRQSLAPCRDGGFLPGAVRLFPLIDTRASAIVRKGAPPLSVEWDGTLRVMDR